MGTLNRTHRLADLQVGVYGSGGAPWHHLALVAAHGATPRVVRAEDIAAGRLAELDALIFPGGGATAMAGLTTPLGEAGATTVREWVAGGGHYVSSCAGSVLPLALSEDAGEMIPHVGCLQMVEAPLANTGDETLAGISSPGVGRIVVRLDTSHPYAAGLQEQIELVHYNGPLFDVARAAPSVEAFAWPTGPTPSFTAAEEFLAPAPAGGHTTFGSCIARGAATAVEARYGEGKATLFGSHPEFGLGPLCLGWGQGSRLLVNALAAPPSARGQAGEPWAVRRGHPDSSSGQLARLAVSELQETGERLELLAQRDPGSWLAEGFAPSFHGRSPRQTWSQELSSAAVAARAAAAGLELLEPVVGESDIPWLDDEPRRDQDFGAMGLSQLLRTIRGQLDSTERALEEAPRRPAHGYDLFDQHPHHLAAASYLSAAGLTAAALLLVALLYFRRGQRSDAIDDLLWLA